MGLLSTIVIIEYHVGNTTLNVGHPISCIQLVINICWRQKIV